MNHKAFKNILFAGLACVIVFAALAFGAVELWSVTFVEWGVLTLVFLWFWQMNNQSGWSFRSTKIDGLIWAFLMLAIISCVFGIYPYAGLLSIGRLLTYTGMYYLVVNHFGWRLQLRLYILAVSVGTALSLLGIGQYSFGLEHPWWNSPALLSATFVNHAHFGGFLEMALALNLGLLLGLDKEDVSSTFGLIQWRIVLTATLSVMGTAFILTQSRGAWIALTVALLLSGIILVREKILPKWVLSGFVVGLLIFVAFLGFGQDRVAYRLHTINTGEESTFFKARLTAWDHSLNIIKDHPLTGTGIGTFALAFPRYRPEGFGARFYYTHNDFLQMITEMGLLTIPLLLWGVMALLKGGFTRDPEDFHLKKAMRLACATGILSLILHGFVDFNFHIPANMLVFVCLTGIVMRNSRTKKARRGLPKEEQTLTTTR